MGVQHINLYDASLRPERRWLTLPSALVAAGVLLLLLLAAAAGFRQATAQQLQRVAQAEAEMRRLAQTPVVAQDAHQREVIQQLRDRLAQAQAFEQQLAALPTSDAAPALLEGLAHAALPDVWVTGLRWEAKEPQLELDGRLMDPGRLPAYLRRLEQQTAFKGYKLSQVQAASAMEAGAPGATFQLRSLGSKGRPR